MICPELEQDILRYELQQLYRANKPKLQPTFEADVKLNNIHYVVVIDRETDRVLSYRAAQW